MFRRTDLPAQLAGAPRPPMQPDPNLEQPPAPGALWAKITGQAAATNRYAWTEIDESDTAAFDTGLSSGFAQTGASTVGDLPAYEINGLTTVPTGTRVRLYPAGDLRYYVFQYAPPGGSSSSSVGDLIGPDQAQTGQIAQFIDPSGRFVGATAGITYSEIRTGIGSQARLAMLDPYCARLAPGAATQRPTLLTLAATFPRGISGFTTSFGGTVYGYTGHFMTGTTASSVSSLGYTDATGAVVLMFVGYSINGASGRHEIYESGGAIRDVTVNVQNWMAHYTSTGTAGITGTCTVKVGGVDKTLTFTEGIITGLA